MTRQEIAAEVSAMKARTIAVLEHEAVLRLLLAAEIDKLKPTDTMRDLVRVAFAYGFDVRAGLVARPPQKKRKARR